LKLFTFIEQRKSGSQTPQERSSPILSVKVSITLASTYHLQAPVTLPTPAPTTKSSDEEDSESSDEDRPIPRSKSEPGTIAKPKASWTEKSAIDKEYSLDISNPFTAIRLMRIDTAARLRAINSSEFQRLELKRTQKEEFVKQFQDTRVDFLFSWLLISRKL
jgi:hypothetical protein